ncbi:MAG: Type 1 glutamine amidotransferase-like domain-containing protein [Oscillospiraceae bacterium]|nr:Type 1 glutamine amidotransferase-like domain-containing protein [Oscillospiraceae bacterium]
MRVMLTSCGLETEGIKNKFTGWLGNEVSGIKALFIPTAANSPDAVRVLPKCLNDLLKCGISSDNITVYDLHKPMSAEELCKYDVVYLCGGSPEYLLGRINEAGFGSLLKSFTEQNGIVIGVSAGSIVFAGNMPDNLGLVKCTLDVHCGKDDCEDCGAANMSKDRIRLGNEQALIFECENAENAYIID